MRYLLLSGMAIAAITLAACSTSDGEDEPFFITPPALTSFVIQQCRTASGAANTLERFDATLINGASFGSDATPENTVPEDSTFTANCIPPPNS